MVERILCRIKNRVVISVICLVLFLVLSINLHILKEHEEPIFRLINRDCSNIILDEFFTLITFSLEIKTKEYTIEKICLRSKAQILHS